MTFTLENVVPWGRSMAEYRRMFSLSGTDIRSHILGCADGPASFNAELTANGGSVVSCDPIYQFTAEEIRRRIDATHSVIVEQANSNSNQFVWSDDVPNANALGRLRMDTMNRFLVDYDAGRNEGRYVAAELPVLPFQDGAFDLAVCSHFLFLYGDKLSETFHMESLRELLRVAKEVRVFPLLQLDLKRSPHVDRVESVLRNEGYRTEVETVNYEFQRGGNQMLRVLR